MANETRYELSVNSEGVTSGLQKARSSWQAYTASVEQASARQTAAQKAVDEARDNGVAVNSRMINATKRFIDSLAQEAAAAGKTRAQLLEMRAAQLGVSDAASGYIQQIQAASAASSSAGKAVHEFSLNSVSARRELAVLAHEAATGAWNNFGGSLLVLAERTDALSMVMSPLGIGIGAVAAAIGGFVYEVAKGATSMSALAHASQITNGYLGLTTDELGEMSRGIAGTGTQITTVQAAMTALVSSGQIAADQLSLATKVTAEFAEDTGMAADKAAEELIKFAKEPQKALEDLQSQYHTFSAAQVDVIENYIKTGDTASAYKAVLQGMDQAHEQFKQHAQENIGVIQKAWQLLKADVIDTINHISQIGVATSNADQLTAAIERQAKAQRSLAQAQAMPFGNTMSAQQELDAANAQVAALQKVQAAQKAAADAAAKRAASGDAAVAVNKYLNDTKFATPLEQRNLAIKKENADFAAATKDLDKTAADYVAAEKRHAGNLAEIEKQYQSRNGSKAAASAASAAAQNAINAQLASLDQQQKDIETKLKASLEHIKSLQDQGVITQEDALAQMHKVRADALQDELKIEQQQVEIAQGKKQKSAIEKYAGEVKSTQDKIKANDQQFTDDSAKLAAKRTADLKVYTDALQQQLATQQAAAASQLAGLSMGSNDRADFERLLAIRQDYDRKVADLAKQRTENRIGQQQYDDELAATQDYYAKSVAIAQKSSADIREANADWTTGARRALADYSDDAANVAASTASTFQDAFRGMEDAFASFVTTGKLDFKSLATSVIADIARMQARAAISGLFNFAASAIGSYFAAGSTSAGLGLSGTSTLADATASSYSGSVTATPFHLAAGGHVTGAGTATSDSIPAWLSNGEYVMSADAVRRIGVGALDAANEGRHVNGAARFASGGFVGAAASASSARRGDINIDAPVTVQGGADASANQSGAADLQKKITAAVRAVVVNERRQGGALWKMANGVA
ncbi:phage tape measure protein [Caballeronia pedi]|uniref:Phage tape measure protein n=1 Tax=Caballeronia pedi TaxID=1777141 RepID=A0A158B7L2_9BURK|nr:phage tail tape measure protein [Caballeronia pedi]SAK65357.1 phage tape measure protein [Caballeronia pedi]